MRPPSIHALVRSRGARLLAAGALTLTLGATAAPVGAHDGKHDHGEETSKTGTSDKSDCTAAEKASLRKLGDNFVQACQPGNDIAQLAGETDLAPGETDSSPNIELLANIPKQGAFANTAALNSDLAFKGDYAFAGNYNGLMVYDISTPAEPKVVTQVVCPGSQGDVSVYKNLLVFSVDSSRSDDSCNSTPLGADNKNAWEGIRVFDISDPANPEYVAAVETDCGSHTHTLAPTGSGKDLFVYVSSYNPNAAFPDCQPPHDKLSVIKIPVASPSAAKIVATPNLFPDGGQPAGGYSRETSGCHDITAYPSKNIAAGACMGDGILLDIKDRAKPRVTERVRDTENFAFWHSATFNNAGTKVVFTDELGGGGAPTCNEQTGPKKGADGIYDIVRGRLKFKSYFKIPRSQDNTENCVAHNGSLIPVPGKDIMVQAWYQGGISVWDFTDSANPKEIAWFDRGPFRDASGNPATSGSWSAYYYNGHIYSNEIQQGFDVFKLTDPRTDAAGKVRMDVFNPQSQPSFNG